MVGEMEERKALGVSVAGGAGGGWEKISGEERIGVAEVGGGDGGGDEGGGAEDSCGVSGFGGCMPGCGAEENGFHQTMSVRRVCERHKSSCFCTGQPGKAGGLCSLHASCVGVVPIRFAAWIWISAQPLCLRPMQSERQPMTGSHSPAHTRTGQRRPLRPVHSDAPNHRPTTRILTRPHSAA